MKKLSALGLLFLAMAITTACGSNEYESSHNDEEMASQETTEPRQD